MVPWHHTLCPRRASRDFGTNLFSTIQLKSSSTRIFFSICLLGVATCCLQHKRLLPRLLFKITSTLQSYTLFSMWKHYYGINWSLKIFHINPVIYHISQSDVWSVWSLSKVKCDMSRTHVSREGGVGEAKGVPDQSDGWQRKRGVEKIEEDYKEEKVNERERE